ncbi:MAG: molybdopterin biosynthesis protein [Halanaerobacter sp.]
MGRDIYLDNISVEDAEDKWYSKLDLEPCREEIDVREARGRITAQKITSNLSAPHYHASAMDGIAVIAQETAGASEKDPISLEKGTDYELIDTGDPVPERFNAVIMIEDVNQVTADKVEIETGVTPWQNVRTVGESLVQGALILPAGHELQAYDIGLVLEGGVTEVEVYSKPQVEIIPTGTELIEPGTAPQPGDIIEYNSHVLGNLVEKWGAEALRSEIVADDYELIKEEVEQRVAERDLVVITAGSSAGREDFTAQVIDELGEVIVHGVSMKPGGPVILGQIKETPVIGVPGYPVAAALTFRLFVRSLIYQLLGKEEPEKREARAKVGTKVVSSLGAREYVRVKLSELNGEQTAIPLSRASGQMGSLVEADALLAISEFSEGVARGDEVKVELLTTPRPEKTLVMSGSNDLTLDILKNQLAQAGIDLITKSSGSMGGLTALKRKEAHLAGAHLLDAETGEYNHSYVEKHLPKRETSLINLVYRQQGLMLRKENAELVGGIEDLAQSELLFMNRQRGAGTRVLFDYKLEEAGISPAEIKGYNRVEYTHMTLAAAVANGGADVGLGVLAAAQAFDLEFIPIAEERYDLIIPHEYQKDSRIEKLLEIIGSTEFKDRVVSLPGYRTAKTGQVMKND